MVSLLLLAFLAFVSAVLFEHAVAGGHVFTGFPDANDVLAVASVPSC
jgi:hypothetical protein